MEFSPWAAPVAVFTPAASADFDFDSLLHQAIDAQLDDDLGDYEIDPVCLTSNLPGAIGPPDPLPYTASTPHAPPLPQPEIRASMASTSRRAPPKPGTAELAYRKAKGKAREKVKAQQRKDAAQYGDFAVKPRLVNKHIKKSGRPIRTSLDASSMPHTSTSYLGVYYSPPLKKVFSLEELVGRDSPYGLELRKWDGWYVLHSSELWYPTNIVCKHPNPHSGQQAARNRHMRGTPRRPIMGYSQRQRYRFHGGCPREAPHPRRFKITSAGRIPGLCCWRVVWRWTRGKPCIPFEE
jgi:hypothetical protein